MGPLKIKNPVINNIVKFITIPVIGYFLLNIVFLLYALIVHGMYRLLNIEQRTPPILIMIVVTLLLFIGFYFLFKTKISSFIKSFLVCIPIAICYLLIGIPLSGYVIIADILGLILCFGILIYLYFKKASWDLFWGVIWISIAMLIMSILRIDI